MPEEIKRAEKQPIESQVSYPDAYSLFQNRNFSFLPHGDYTEFVVPLAVTVKKFYLPPDTFAVSLNTEYSVLYLYSPSQEGGKVQVSDKLDNSEISWITDFLDYRGEKFSDNMWSLSQKDFNILEILCQERYKSMRKTIVTEMNPYTPINDILKVLKAMIDIVGEC